VEVDKTATSEGVSRRYCSKGRCLRASRVNLHLMHHTYSSNNGWPEASLCSRVIVFFRTTKQRQTRVKGKPPQLRTNSLFLKSSGFDRRSHMYDEYEQGKRSNSTDKATSRMGSIGKSIVYIAYEKARGGMCLIFRNGSKIDWPKT
jgi:hypothetical protein